MTGEMMGGMKIQKPFIYAAFSPPTGGMETISNILYAQVFPSSWEEGLGVEENNPIPLPGRARSIPSEGTFSSQ